MTEASRGVAAFLEFRQQLEQKLLADLVPMIGDEGIHPDGSWKWYAFLDRLCQALTQSTLQEVLAFGANFGSIHELSVPASKCAMTLLRKEPFGTLVDIYDSATAQVGGQRSQWLIDTVFDVIEDMVLDVSGTNIPVWFTDATGSIHSGTHCPRLVILFDFKELELKAAAALVQTPPPA